MLPFFCFLLVLHKNIKKLLLKKVNPNKVKKKKILLLTDDLRMHSGIATMSREFVMGTIHKYDWVQIGGAIKHPENGKIIDEGTGADVLGNPLAAVAWLSNHLAYQGKELQRNMIVMTGSIVTTYFPQLGDRLKFSVEGLGDVYLNLSELC